MKRATRMVAVVAASAATFAMAACGGSGSSSNSAADKGAKSVISVVASINQWGSVASELGGSKVKVTSIMSNTNVEAHDYEPTTADISKISAADVTVVNGADYDPWASKAAKSTKATLVDAGATDGKKAGDNPHVWFSADVRKTTADAITKAYEKAMPSQRAISRRRTPLGTARKPLSRRRSRTLAARRRACPMRPPSPSPGTSPMIWA